MKNPWARSGDRPNQEPLGVYFGQDNYRGHVLERNMVPALPFALSPVGMPLADLED